MLFITEQFFTDKCSTVEMSFLLPKEETYQGGCHPWGPWISKWRCSSSNVKEKWDMKSSGPWGSTNQMTGHKDGFSLFRLKMYLPQKINQVLIKYLLKTNHHRPCHQLQKLILCVTHTLPELDHRRAKLWIVIGETKYDYKDNNTEISTESTIQ